MWTLGLPLSAQCVCRILSVCPAVLSVCPAVSNMQAVIALAKTRRWSNAGLMLAHRLRRCASISPVLGYLVVFGATLNVGQCHRRLANIAQLWFKASCQCRQHEDLGWMQPFPTRSKFHWTVGPVNLKLLPDQKKFHQTVGGQWPVLTLWDQKNDQKTKLTKKTDGL